MTGQISLPWGESSIKKANYDYQLLQDSLTDQCCYLLTHSSGLRVYYQPKAHFHKKFAAFGIPYGSSCRSFRRMPIEGRSSTEGAAEGAADARSAEGAVDVAAAEAEAADVAVRPGTAHYLEHCVFTRNEDGDLMTKMAALGCQANAYTSYNQTVYFYSGEHNYTQAFFAFFHALLHPELTAERIEQERGIILAELSMYEDDAENVAFNKMMAALFVEVGVKDDIGGEAADIMAMTAEELRVVHQAFYQAASMQIVLCGDFYSSDMLELLEGIDQAVQKCAKRTEIQMRMEDEPARVLHKLQELHQPVENDSFLLAYKDLSCHRQKLQACQLAARNIEMSFFLDSLLGESSANYHKLCAEAYINDSFSVQYVCEQDHAFLLVAGESRRPALSAEAIHDILTRVCAEDAELDEMSEIFEIQKKAAVGHYLRSLDGVESAGMTLLQASMSGVENLAYAALIDQASLKQALLTLKAILQQDLRAEVHVLKRSK